jgi:hypothetical protein
VGETSRFSAPTRLSLGSATERLRMTVAEQWLVILNPAVDERG